MGGGGGGERREEDEDEDERGKVTLECGRRRSTEEYKGRTDSNSPTRPNETVCVTTLATIIYTKIGGRGREGK